MEDIKIPQGDGPMGAIKGFFGFKRKGYAEIMSAFLTVKNDLQTLIANNNEDIAKIDEDINKLQAEKAVVVEEKGKAIDTLEFLDKMVK